jgi:acylphosphatase
VEKNRHVRVRVTGRVQGVFFRAATAQKAAELGLAGFVRNLDDGTVEFEAQGSDVAVDALCEWARQGPPAACVDSLNIEDLALNGQLTKFEIRH